MGVPRQIFMSWASACRPITECNAWPTEERGRARNSKQGHSTSGLLFFTVLMMTLGQDIDKDKILIEVEGGALGEAVAGVYSKGHSNMW